MLCNHNWADNGKTLSVWFKNLLTCSNPPVSPTAFRWFIINCSGFWDVSLANIIIANTGTCMSCLKFWYSRMALYNIMNFTASSKRISYSIGLKLKLDKRCMTRLSSWCIWAFSCTCKTLQDSRLTSRRLLIWVRNRNNVELLCLKACQSLCDALMGILQ